MLLSDIICFFSSSNNLGKSIAWIAFKISSLFSVCGSSFLGKWLFTLLCSFLTNLSDLIFPNPFVRSPSEPDSGLEELDDDDDELEEDEEEDEEEDDDFLRFFFFLSILASWGGSEEESEMSSSSSLFFTGSAVTGSEIHG